MEKDPLNEVFSFVERTYIRLQAGDLINRCLEDCSLNPIQQIIEQLVLAGSQSLSVLREIKGEAEQRKSLVQQDIYQLLRDFAKSLESYGINLQNRKIETFIRMRRARFLHLLDQQNIFDEETRSASIQLLKDSQDLFKNLFSRAQLLIELDNYLQDWIWAVAIQSARQDEEIDPKLSSSH